MADIFDDLKATEALKEGDPCEFRYPARAEWCKGIVVKNGGHGYWEVKDINGTGRVAKGLYIEHVRAPGTDPWS